LSVQRTASVLRSRTSMNAPPRKHLLPKQSKEAICNCSSSPAFSRTLAGSIVNCAPRAPASSTLAISAFLGGR
jgi:hypothetical protein